MKTKNIILYVIICLIIIAGIAVWDSKGFNTELQYSSRYEINLSNNEGIAISDIEEIASSVLGNTTFFVQEVETFGNAVAIVAEEITTEQKDEIVEKFNEKYNYDLNKDDVDIKYIPFSRVKDVIKHFILAGIIALTLVLLYFLIRFRKIGWKQVLLKTIFIPILMELLIYSFMAIVRIPFGRVAIALSIGLYMVSIIILTCIFENQRNKYIEDMQNKENN